MSFNPQTLRAKLAASTETADSITSTAHWILFYKRHAPAVAQHWAEAVTVDENKLAEIYIANEVIQQSKIKKKAEFVSAFAAVLPAALEAAYSGADLPTRDRIARVVKVWRERLVFSPDEQKLIEGALSSHAGTPAVHVDLRPLAKAYADLHAAVKSGNPNAEQLAEEVQASLSGLSTRVSELMANLPAAIEAPEVEPLSPAGQNEQTPEPDAAPASDNDEPQAYTAKDAQASVAAAATNFTDDNDGEVGYADSDSGEDERQSTEGPPEKKARVEVDPQLSSFLATLSKGGM